MASTPTAAQTKTGTQVPHDGPGFPPFDASTFSAQLVWLAITFGFLYYLMSKIALPRIGEVLEERRDRIQRDLDDAERLKADTEKALKAYETSLAEARGRAQGIAKDTRDQLSGEVEKERLRVEAEMNAKVADAERRIVETKARALTHVQEIASDTAGAVVSSLIGVQATSDEIAKAVAAARS